MQVPTSAHSIVAKHVLQYLKHTLDYGLFYKPGSFAINAYCDSDWASDLDDRRSTCGYGVFIRPNLISWSAKKQLVVSKSSTEAEYWCLALITAEVYWLRMLLRELQVSFASALVTWCDNINVLSLASNPIFHARLKHIGVDYHFVREKVANKDILLRHIPTSLQPADIFTKGHTANRFYFLRDKLSVIDFPASLRENDKDKAHYTKIVKRY
jgi:histone deacetylase 1/2